MRKNKREFDFNRDLFDADKKSICIFDTRNKINLYNKNFQIHAKASDEISLIGTDLYDSLKIRRKTNSNNQQNILNEVASAIENRQFYINEDLELEEKDSEKPVPIRLTITPFISNNEQFFQLEFEDILKETKEEQTQTDFVSVMSHELRTPIATVNGYLELALNPEFATIDENARKYITSAHDSSNHLSDLLRSLLSVTRIDSKDASFDTRVKDATELLKTVSKEFFVIAQNKNILFKMNIKNEESYIKTNPIIFREIISNLINNAIKYTKSGGTVELAASKIGNKLVISVKDTGEGIKPDDLEHIFTKFYRATSTKEQGSGLGLYLVKRQTEILGGKIFCQSEFGKGSTFTISFPLIDITNKDLAKTSFEEFTPMTVEEINKFDPITDDMQKYVRYPKLSNNPVVKNYVELSKRWSRGEIPSTSEDEKQKVYNAYKKQVTDLSLSKFDKIWIQIKPRLDNVGLARFGRFFVSKYVIPWILEAPSSVSWELAFGFGYDYEWNWKQIEKEDQLYWFVVRDPQLNWIRQRSILARKEIADKDKVLFLNAGQLPELRHVNGFGMPKEVYACDEERTINTENIFGWSTKEHNVRYERSDILDYIDRMAVEDKKFNTVVMDGGSFQNFKEIDKIIASVMTILEQGGKFVFDLQPLQWDHEIMNYVLSVVYSDETTTPKDIQTGIDTIERICDNIGGIRAKYTIDKRNDEPSGIMFYLEKI